MKGKYFAALCSGLGLTASVAGFADDNMSSMSNNNKNMPVFEEGGPIKEGQFPAGYNHAARINPQGGNDFFVTGSFIYWEACSDDFDFGRYTNTTPTLVGYPTFGGHQVFLEPEYHPGFKVALGYNSSFDDWGMLLEYTWLNFSTKSSFSAPTGDLFVLNYSNSSKAGLFTFTGATTANNLSLGWRQDMSLLDFNLCRGYYQGTRVTVEPFVGLRAAWFEGHESISATGGQTVLASSLGSAANIKSVSHSESWGLGPRFGVKSQWLLGSGFRVDGKASFSTLFTSYSELHTRTTTGTTVTAHDNWGDDYNNVRPAAELGLGFAWGSYFGDMGYHFDLAATYDFNIFWNQNMMRSIYDSANYGSKTNPSDLVYHGPTVTVRFDF